jgi:hypothetical protein
MYQFKLSLWSEASEDWVGGEEISYKCSNVKRKSVRLCFKDLYEQSLFCSFVFSNTDIFF